MQHMVEYDDKKFADASKDELKMRDKDEKESKRDKVCVTLMENHQKYVYVVLILPGIFTMIF